MRYYLIEASYFLASILFILGLRGLSHPETARRGMHLAEFGMLMAIIGTLMHQEIVSYEWIIAGLLLGIRHRHRNRSVGADDGDAAANRLFPRFRGFGGRARGHFGVFVARCQSEQVYHGSFGF